MYYAYAYMRVVLIELNISALSDFQTPRQQMSQFWSEDFSAHILQISSFRTSGGCRFFVQLIMKFRRIYAGMNESSGTP